MDIEITKDNNRRICSICKKRIKAGKIIVKYDYIIDAWKNHRKWFSHIDCLIKKLNSSKNYFEKELKKIPSIPKISIERGK